MATTVSGAVVQQQQGPGAGPTSSSASTPAAAAMVSVLSAAAAAAAAGGDGATTRMTVDTAGAAAAAGAAAPAATAAGAAAATGSGPQKTPISILQELCTKRGITPTYELKNIQGPVHEPSFVYAVTVGELSANGAGSSKKKAKHCAAQNALDRIEGLPESCPIAATTIVGGPAQGVVSQTSQQEGSGGGATPAGGVATGAPTGPSAAGGTGGAGGVPGNPIGALQEFAMLHHWPPPIYSLQEEKGQPHEREFTITVTCGYNLTDKGCGRSKRIAKRQAAHRMLSKLAELKDTNGGQAMKELDAKIKALAMAGAASGGSTDAGALTNAAAAVAATAAAGAAGGIMPVPILYQQVNLRAKIQELQTSSGTKLASLLQQSLNGIVNYKETLAELMTDHRMEYKYMDIDEKTLNGYHQCLVCLGLQPCIAVCYGLGQTPEDSQKYAAFTALHYLKCLLKPPPQPSPA